VCIVNTRDWHKELWLNGYDSKPNNTKPGWHNCLDRNRREANGGIHELPIAKQNQGVTVIKTNSYIAFIESAMFLLHNTPSQ
jgi:hypothetical protein